MTVNLVIPSFVVASLASGDYPKLERIVRGSATIAFIPTALATAVCFGFAEPLLALVYGDGFEHAATFFRILAIGDVAFVVTGSCGLILIMSGQYRLAVRIVTATTIPTVAVAILATQRFGGNSLATATAAGTAIQNLAMAAAVRRSVGVWSFPYANPRRSQGLARDVQTPWTVPGRPPPVIGFEDRRSRNVDWGQHINGFPLRDCAGR